MDLLVTIQRFLWIAGPVLQVVLVVEMWRRGVFREVPWFFSYTVFHIVQFAALFVLKPLSYTGYFVAYWFSDAVDALLALIVIQEIFSYCFREYPGLKDLAQLLFRWTTIVLIAVAFIVALATPGRDTDRIVAGLMAMQRSVNFVQCGLLFLLVLISRMTGLGFESRAIGVGVGFGTMASIFTITMVLSSYMGLSDDFASLIVAAAYDVAVAIWIVAILQPVRKQSAVALPSRAAVVQLDTTLRHLFR